jgi:hypothetical protein
LQHHGRQWYDLGGKEMKNRRSRSSSRWSFVLAGGVFLGWLLGRSWARQLRFPQLRTIQKGLTETHGEVEAAFMSGRIQQRYEELYLHRPRFHMRRLQTHLDKNLIPGLALYQVLLDHTGDKQRALKEVQDLLFRGLMGKSYLVGRLLQHIPEPFAVLRRAVRLVNRVAFPTPGWEMEYIVDDGQSIAFKIHECMYLKVLSAYGAPELTQVFCQFDDYIAEFFPAQISWKRESTLALGSSHCDFCYALVKEESKE